MNNLRAHLNNVDLDVPDMIVFLQLMGFRLEQCEKVVDVEHVPIIQDYCDASNKNVLKVDITCPKSGIRGVMVKQTNSCQCPEEQNVQNKWETSCSWNPIETTTVLPNISPRNIDSIKNDLSNIIRLIKNVDINQNETFKLSSTIENDTKPHEETIILKDPQESFWEIEPKITPPTHTSSPLQEEETLNLSKSTELLKTLKSIQNQVNDAINIVSGVNSTYIQKGAIKRAPCINPVPQIKYQSTDRKFNDLTRTLQTKNANSPLKTGVMQPKVPASNISTKPYKFIRQPIKGNSVNIRSPRPNPTSTGLSKFKNTGKVVVASSVLRKYNTDLLRISEKSPECKASHRLMKHNSMEQLPSSKLPLSKNIRPVKHGLRAVSNDPSDENQAGPSGISRLQNIGNTSVTKKRI